VTVGGPVVVFAGVPCVGKSYLLGKLEAGQAPAVAEALGNPDIAAWRAINIKSYPDTANSTANPLLLHVDLFAIRSEARANKFRQLIAERDRVIFVIAVAPATVLRGRHNQRVARFLGSLLSPDTWATGSVGRRLRRHWNLLRLYRRPSRLMDLYTDWLRIVGAQSGDCLLVDCGAPELRVTRNVADEALREIIRRAS
jgi:hypothetical protein